MKTINLVIFNILITLLFSSCNNDENAEIPVEDYFLEILERPNSNQVLGVLKAENDGDVLFSLISETLDEAFNVHSSTGEISVGDKSLWLYQTNPFISGQVNVLTPDGGIAKRINIKISLMPMEISASDFAYDFFEKPIAEEVIGWIGGTINNPAIPATSIIPSIINQTPNGAVKLNQNNQLVVSDPTLFDYEANPVITGELKLTYEDVSQNVSFKINLKKLIYTFPEDITVRITTPPSQNEFIFVLNTNDLEQSSNYYPSTYLDRPSYANALQESTGHSTFLYSLVLQEPSGYVESDWEKSIRLTSYIDPQEIPSIKLVFGAYVRGNIYREFTATIILDY